jgi:1-acyl-sn-glycerol-3-phosphate acyltransferase
MLLRALVRLYRPLVRVEDPGRNAELDDPLIFAFNHNNAFESLGVPAMLIHRRGGRLIHFMVDWMFLHLPVVGWVIRQMDPIPVFTKPARFRIGERYRLARRQLSPVEGCLDRLGRGGSVGVFPEGTRNPRPDILLRGRAGIGHLILASAVPVVPVGIEFTGTVRNGRVPRAGRMTVRVGSRLLFSEERRAFLRITHRDRDRHAIVREARHLSWRVIDTTMNALAPLCAKRYPHGRSCHVTAPSRALPELVRAGGTR